MSVGRGSDFRESVSHALAGAAASAFSMMVFYPLETIRIRMQVAMTEDMDEETNPSNRRRDSISSPLYSAQSILKKEGFEGLYMGIGPTLFGITISQFIYFFLARFFTQQYLRYQKYGKVSLDPVSNMVVAGSASVVNALLTCPLWVVIMRLKIDREHRFRGMFHCCTEIVRDGGYTALYEGLVPSLWLVCTPIVQYVAYEQSRQVMARWMHPIKLRTPHFFVLGGLAKLAATLMTYPMQVVQAVVTTQNEAEKAATRGDGVLGCMAHIYKADGVPGLYRGLLVKLWQTVLSTALMFCAYENILASTQTMLDVQPRLRVSSPKQRM
jgi:hypothetical protein